MIENKIYAVVTGDIVGSSKLNMNGQPNVSSVIQSAAARISAQYQSSVHGDIDIFRGDSWQMVIAKPEYSLRIGLLLRSLLLSTPGFKQLDTRFSIGFGSIDYLPENNISTGNGEAFLLSGTGLERCKKPIRMCLNFPQGFRSSTTRALNIIIRLIDLHVQHWTNKQAEAASGVLIGLTQREIANNWVKEPVTQQAISQHLEGAGWTQINDSLEYFESILPTLF